MRGGSTTHPPQNKILCDFVLVSIPLVRIGRDTRRTRILWCHIDVGVSHSTTWFWSGSFSQSNHFHRQLQWLFALPLYDDKAQVITYPSVYGRLTPILSRAYVFIRLGPPYALILLDSLFCRHLSSITATHTLALDGNGHPSKKPRIGDMVLRTGREWFIPLMAFHESYTVEHLPTV
jgi:hypothetical protein